jgi:tetratricopeptide (TPR) repeat protein
LQIRLKDIPVVKNYFTGRDEKLAELKTAFDKSPFILIEGGGGIGKTQLVSRFINDEGLKDKTVWFVCEPTSSPDDIIRGAGFEEILKGENKPEREKFSAFKDKIEEYDLVVLLDNYQEVEGKENFKSFLWFINEYLGKGHVIIICRDNIAGLSAVQPKRLHIDGLGTHSVEHARGLINHLYPDTKVTDDVLLHICNTLQGYPLAIDLSINLLSQNTPPEQIIAAAVKGANEGNDKIEEMVKRLLNEIFTRKDATEEEKDFLKLFSIFRGKVEEAAARAVIPAAIFDKASQSLKHRNILNIQDGYFELHPLIREFAYDKLLQKEAPHLSAANYYKALRSDKLNPELEEKIYSHFAAAGGWNEICDTIINKGKNFILFGYLDQLQQMITEVKKHELLPEFFHILEGDIAEIKGSWKNAIACFETAEKSNNDQIKTEGNIKHGEMLYRIGETKAAQIIFEQAIRNTEHSVELEIWYARAINDMGLVYDAFEKYEESQALFNKALTIRKKLGIRQDIAITIKNIATNKIHTKHYKQALELLEQSLEINEEIGDKIGIDICLHQIGTIKIKLGKDKEAMTYFERALNIGSEVGDKNGKAKTLNQIGVLLSRAGKKEEALEHYRDSLKIKEEMGDKGGIAVALNNIASSLIDGNTELEKSVFYLLKSIALTKEVGKKKTNVELSWLNVVKQKIGVLPFKEMVNKEMAQLDEPLRAQIDIHEVLGEPKHVETKIGRNAPCPCGSGKKYKACHGKGE